MYRIVARSLGSHGQEARNGKDGQDPEHVGHKVGRLAAGPDGGGSGRGSRKREQRATSAGPIRQTIQSATDAHRSRRGRDASVKIGQVYDKSPGRSRITPGQDLASGQILANPVG